MFWKKKRGQDDLKKKRKLDPEGEIENPKYQEMPGIFEPAEVRKEEYVTTKTRVKGVWTLVEDVSTGKVYYRNKLNGKTQNNPPIGIKTEDLQYEKIESIQIPDTFIPETEFQFSTEYPDIPKYKAAEPGEWEEVAPSYWFEGHHQDENTETHQIIPDIPEQVIASPTNNEYESDDDLTLEISQHSPVYSFQAVSSPVPNSTLYLKQHIDEEAEELFIEKPVYTKSVLSTSTTFSKRAKKNTLKL